MPVGFMTEATPAGRDGRSAVQVGNRSRSGPEVTAPGGGRWFCMTTWESRPRLEPAKGGPPGSASMCRGTLMTGLSRVAAWVFQV